jgi:hypothetical protein
MKNFAIALGCFGIAHLFAHSKFDKLSCFMLKFNLFTLVACTFFYEILTEFFIFYLFF